MKDHTVGDRLQPSRYILTELNKFTITNQPTILIKKKYSTKLR